MGTGQLNQSYNFPSIVGGGTYTIAMDVSNEVPVGDGSIAVGFGTMTLTGAVPEPSTGVLCLAAVGMLALFGRRMSK
jgi:hypothetical protein